MKTWLITHKKQLLAVGMAAVIAVAFCLGWCAGSGATDRKAYAALWEAMVDLPDPERCALCAEGRPYQTPCLVNLSTGQMGEMRVYTYGPTQEGKLDPREAQCSGTFNFLPCAGLMAIRDNDFHTCQVILPKERGLINPAHFCKECRLLLAGAGLEGYAVIDLHDPDHKLAYPVRKGADEVIRDYRVCVDNAADGGLEVCVIGLLEY